MKESALQLKNVPIYQQMERTEVKAEIQGLLKNLLKAAGQTYHPLMSGHHLDDTLDELYHEFYIYLVERPSHLPIDKIHSIAVVKSELKRFLNHLLCQKDKGFALKKILHQKIVKVLKDFPEDFCLETHQWRLSQQIDFKGYLETIGQKKYLTAIYESYHENDKKPILVKTIELREFLIGLLGQQPYSLNELVSIVWKRLKPSPEDILKQMDPNTLIENQGVLQEFSFLEWEKNRMKLSAQFVSSLSSNEQNVGKLLLSDLSLRKKASLLDQSHKNIDYTQKSILKKLKALICHELLGLSQEEFEEQSQNGFLCFLNTNEDLEGKIIDLINNIEFDLQQDCV